MLFSCLDLNFCLLKLVLTLTKSIYKCRLDDSLIKVYLDNLARKCIRVNLQLSQYRWHQTVLSELVFQSTVIARTQILKSGQSYFLKDPPYFSFAVVLA